MSELRKVTGPSSPVYKQVGMIVGVVVVAMFIAIAKPWGSGTSSDVGSVVPVPSRSASPSPTVSPAPLQYDLRAFGIREPTPVWEIWSAGSLASYSFAMRIDLAAHATPLPVPSGGGASPSGIAASAMPVGPPGALDDSVPGDWPTVPIAAGNTLELIGINRPLGFSVIVVDLVRVADDGTETSMHAIIGSSPWPDHFAVVGIGTDAKPGTMQPWPAGHFRLVLRIDPGAIDRSVDIVVEPTPQAAPSSSVGADVGGS